MIARYILLLLLSFLAGATSFAQETAPSLVKQLQEQFLSAPEVSLAFDLANEGRVTITADLHTGHIRIESPSMLIISDAHTVWNYQKREDRVTIDNVTVGSAFKDPASLFRFADDYTANVTTWNSKMQCMLELTPKPALQPLLKAAGALQTITLELRTGKEVKIESASATSANGTTRAEKLSIKTLPKIHEQDFIFKPKPSTKVIDLRE